MKKNQNLSLVQRKELSLIWQERARIVPKLQLIKQSGQASCGPMASVQIEWFADVSSPSLVISLLEKSSYAKLDFKEFT